MTTIFCAEDIKSRFVGFRENVQVTDLLDVRAADFGVTRVWSKEDVIEAAQQGSGANDGWKEAMLKDAEHFARQVILWDAVAMIECRLRAPTNIKRGLNARFCPIHNFSQFVPVFHFFKRHLFHRRTCNNESVKFFTADVIESEIVVEQMLRVRVLGFMRGSMQQSYFHLQRGIGKQAQELCFGRDFCRHEIKDRHTQWSDILMDCAFFIHHEDMLTFERLTSRKGSRDFYGHGFSRDECRRMKFCLLPFILPTSSFILSN